MLGFKLNHVSEIPYIYPTAAHALTKHWGRVTRICFSKLTIIDNGISPNLRRAIIWTNAKIFLIRPSGTNLSETPYPDPVYTGWSSVHWNATGWPSVHWNTTGKNLVETAPHKHWLLILVVHMLRYGSIATKHFLKLCTLAGPGGRKLRGVFC